MKDQQTTTSMGRRIVGYCYLMRRLPVTGTSAVAPSLNMYSTPTVSSLRVYWYKYQVRNRYQYCLSVRCSCWYGFSVWI
jgi:hypothetical protein